MKTERIALPFVCEIRPLLDNCELQYEPVGDIDFCKLPNLVQEYIDAQIKDLLSEYHEAVCKRFTQLVECIFTYHVPSSELKYTGFDEADIYADFSYDEKELAEVLDMKMDDIDADVIYEKIQQLTESESTTKWRMQDLNPEVGRFVCLSEYIDLSCFAKLAEQAFELSRHADWEFEEYKRQTNFTEEKYAMIRAEQLAIVERQIKDMIYNFEEN